MAQTDFKKFLQSLHKGKYAPVYLIDGEEPYYLDIITDYFEEVSAALAVAPTRYAVGVYGSGLTCRIIRDAGLAAFTWLAGSTGFQESAKFRPQADLIQVLPSRKICGNKLSIDDDVAQSENFGAFRISGGVS